MSTGRYAGFASVISVGSDCIDGALAAASSLVPMPKVSLPDIVKIGTDTIGLSGSLVLLPPTVQLTENKDNLIGINYGCSGLLRFTSNKKNLVEVEVTLTASISVAFDVDVSPASLAIRLDLSHAEVSAIGIKVTFGPPLPKTYTDAIQDPSVLTALSSALKAIPSNSLAFTIPGAKGTIDFSMAGISVSLPITRIVVKPLNGALNIAADVSPYTTGNESALVNLITTWSPLPFIKQYGSGGSVTYVTGENNGFGVNVAVALNSNFVSAVVSGQLSKELTGKNISGVTVNSIALSFDGVTSVLSQSDLPGASYECITAIFSGSYDSISFTLIASATTMLTQGLGQPSWSFPIVAWSLDSSAIGILSILVPLGFIIVPDVVNSAVDPIIRQVLSSLPIGGFATGATQPIPGIPSWNISYNITSMGVWSENAEIDMYASAIASGPPVSIGPTTSKFSLSSPGGVLTSRAHIPVKLHIQGIPLFDPLLGIHISWKVIRNDTGATVLSEDKPLTAATTKIEIDRWTGDLKFNDTWTVTCEVYRPADSLIPQYIYFTGTINTGVTDVVDRHHPYVHWDHDAYFRDPLGPPPLTSHPFWSRSRHSRIHRTDLLIRCKVLDIALASGHKGAPVYLDSLSSYGTFSGVENWRHGVLCDYCFFGGPTKTEWKTPTLPTQPFV